MSVFFFQWTDKSKASKAMNQSSKPTDAHTHRHRHTGCTTNVRMRMVQTGQVRNKCCFPIDSRAFFNTSRADDSACYSILRLVALLLVFLPNHAATHSLHKPPFPLQHTLPSSKRKRRRRQSLILSLQTLFDSLSSSIFTSRSLLNIGWLCLKPTNEWDWIVFCWFRWGKKKQKTNWSSTSESC